MENICKNCESARKRCEHDFRKYGSYGYSFECLKVIDRTEYKKADDSCPLFKERGKKHEMQNTEN